MRQFSTIILLMSIILSGIIMPAFSSVTGKIEYSIPVDYSKLNEQEIVQKADKYFYLASKLKDGTVNEDITNALLLYNILQNMNPKNIEYAVKAGVLYDKISKDRQARGCLSRAIGIDSSKPSPYFYLGEFYYKRKLYKRALKCYNEAYKLGLKTNYDLLYKMGDIYEKFGDTRSALKYLKEAQLQSSNPEIDNKIKYVEQKHTTNQEYYSETRIRG